LKEVGWGILGAGWLVNQAIADAFHHADGARLVAAGARDIGRAKAIRPDRAFDSYQAVIEDPGVEAVYIALANDAHLAWIQAAIAAGKHVLCEKPMVLTAEETELVFAQADAAGVLLVEAVWSRWHPRMRRIIELATSGILGEVTTFLGTFTFNGVPPGNYRLSRAHGGGALLDVGIYPLHTLIGGLPAGETLRVVSADIARDLDAHEDDAVDLTTKATLAWGHGSRAFVVASFAMPSSQRLEIRGSEATLRVDDDQAFTSWREPSRLLIGDSIETFPQVDAYQVMVAEVSKKIRGGKGWIPPLIESVRVARTVDQISAFANESRNG
jgi:D-xylose 1-dehydrogenase (NADP+, D-xylono-1,5-lactone-forming)